MKILITGGKSALSLKLLRAFEGDTIVFADYGDVPSFFANNYEFISLGDRNDEILAHTLLSCCLDYEIDVVLPLHSFEIESLVKASILFNEFNVYVLLPILEQLDRYTNEGAIKKSDWGVMINGKVIYSTQQHEALKLYTKKETLNGAYYFELNNNEVKLSLIKI